jgi:hypothetical protein
MASLRAAVARVLLVGGLCLPASLVLIGPIPRDASASVSIAVSFDALLKDADAVAVITPVDSQSIWEDGRIYTYTKVKVEQGVAGDVGTGSEQWVRTMGGVVGKIGQMVDGEPVFILGKQSLLFLRKYKSNAIFEVSARGQGQYPVTVDENTKIRKVIRSATAGVLLPPRQPRSVAAIESKLEPQSVTTPAPLESPVMPKLAHDVIHGKLLDDATREIAAAWKRLHAPPPAK